MKPKVLPAYTSDLGFLYIVEVKECRRCPRTSCFKLTQNTNISKGDLYLLFVSVQEKIFKHAGSNREIIFLSHKPVYLYRCTCNHRKLQDLEATAKCVNTYFDRHFTWHVHVHPT